MQNSYSLHMAVQLYSNYCAVYYSSIYAQISQVATSGFLTKILRAFLVTCVIHVRSDLFSNDHMNIVLWLKFLNRHSIGGGGDQVLFTFKNR
jgi:hypothetical protein